MTRQLVTNFSRGEFGPQLYGRVDVPQYSAGAKKMRNFIVQRYGGAAFRPGFSFVGEADDATTPRRLMPFQFSTDQAYVLAFGEKQMRPLAAGGFISTADIKITSISKAPQALVVAHYHGLSVGDRVFFNGVSGMTEINGVFAKVLQVISIHRIVIDTDTTSFSTFTSSTGVEQTAPPPVNNPQPSDDPIVSTPPSTGTGDGTSSTPTAPSGGSGYTGPGTYSIWENLNKVQD